MICKTNTSVCVCGKDNLCKVSESMTNEEHLRSCSFEELAGAIYEWFTLGFTRGKNGKKLNSVTEIVEWLKKKHHG